MEQEQIDAIRVWVKESINKVYKWKNTRIFPDEFNRPNGPTVGNGWNEDEKTLKISLKDGAVQFGPQKAATNEMTALWREYDASRVLKASFTVWLDPTSSAGLEINFRLPQGKVDTTFLGLIRRLDGTVALHVKKDQKTKPDEEYVDLPNFAWPQDGVVNFGFVKMNEEKGIVSLLLNGKPVAGGENLEVLNLIKSRGGKIRVEVRCSGAGGTELDCRVEAAEIWLDVQ
jgi:hypothetical protein